MVWISTYIEVDLSDLDDDDLLIELQSRGYKMIGSGEDMPLIEEMYYAYTLKQHEKFEQLLREFFDEHIGRII